MGWTYTHKDKYTKVIDFLKREFTWEKVEIIDGSVVHFRTAYLACRVKETGRVFALICLLNFNRHEYENFGYKEIEEDCGPYQFECPKRILKLLTEPVTPVAKEWRERCLGRFTKPEIYGHVLNTVA